MHRLLLALVLVLAATPAAAARDALTAIDGCLKQLDPSLDVGYEKIAARCPELAPALRASPWAAWLPRNWDKPGNELSDQGLTELRTLIVRESQRRAGMSAPHIAGVSAVLAALKTGEPQPTSWWERFKAWLRGILEAGAAADTDSWLARLLGTAQLSEGVARLTLVAVCAILVALAGAVLINELRLAGWLRRRARHGAARAVDGGPERAGVCDLRQIEAAAEEARPGLLLELIARRLYDQGRLPPAGALTVQELLRSVRLADEADRERLRVLAAASERLRFSDRVPGPEALGAALAGGRELLAGLAAARA
jgi:hypothetical protein